jgi:hypothetical protein
MIARDHMRLIEGGRASRRSIRRKGLTETEQLLCWKCEQAGVATSLVCKATASPRRTASGKIVAGSNHWVCIYCLTRGVTTILSR